MSNDTHDLFPAHSRLISRDAEISGQPLHYEIHTLPRGSAGTDPGSGWFEKILTDSLCVFQCLERKQSDLCRQRHGSRDARLMVAAVSVQYGFEYRKSEAAHPACHLRAMWCRQKSGPDSKPLHVAVAATDKS